MMIQLSMLFKIAILVVVAASSSIDPFSDVDYFQAQLNRSSRDSIGNNRMVNTVYRATKNQKLDSNEIRQQQKNQQSNLMNQYSAFFMNQLQSSSGPEAKSSLSEAELKKKLKMAYMRILRQRRKELMQLYG